MKDLGLVDLEETQRDALSKRELDTLVCKSLAHDEVGSCRTSPGGTTRAASVSRMP